jgi:hypothetical protein
MSLVLRKEVEVELTNARLASKVKQLVLGDTSVNLAVEMYTDDDDGHRHTNGHSSPAYYVKRDEDATFNIAMREINSRYECFADLGVGGEEAVIERGLVAARAVGAEDYYACDIAPGLIQGAVELAERRGFYAKPFECDIFEKLPFIRPKALIGVLGLTIGNVETYKNPETVKQRLTEIYRHYARAVTNPNPTIKPSGGLLIGWDANMNIKDIEACYDNPQMADLIRSCPERVADTSKFDYHIVAERVKLNKDEEVCFVSLGLRARKAHIMLCGEGAVPVKADQFVPVLNTDRFSVPLMVDAFKRAGWRPDEKQLWSATDRVHYQHCALA